MERKTWGAIRSGRSEVRENVDLITTFTIVNESASSFDRRGGSGLPVGACESAIMMASLRRRDPRRSPRVSASPVRFRQGKMRAWGRGSSSLTAEAMLG